jgi:hypothetical protein
MQKKYFEISRLEIHPRVVDSEYRMSPQSVTICDSGQSPWLLTPLPIQIREVSWQR